MKQLSLSTIQLLALGGPHNHLRDLVGPSQLLLATLMNLGQDTMVHREGLALCALITLGPLVARAAGILVPLPAVRLKQDRGIRLSVLVGPISYLSAGDTRGLATADVVAGRAGGAVRLAGPAGCDGAGHFWDHELAAGEGGSGSEEEGGNDELHHDGFTVFDSLGQRRLWVIFSSGSCQTDSCVGGDDIEYG
ncbi:hypothetical protein VUR80DRAFT_6321 [Thermomyces stellatus]